MKKVVIVIGTRPEAIKLIPVHLEFLKKKTTETILVSTGQHKEMLNQIFSFFDVNPDYDLELMKPNQDLTQLSMGLFDQLGRLINQINPDIMIVQGDTTTAMIASLIGFYKKVEVWHVEAGLRTNDKYNPFPEEVNRRIISLTSDAHFAPTKMAEENLRKEGIERVYMVGNTVIDAVLISKDKLLNNQSKYKAQFRFLDTFDKVVLITCHRREIFGDALREICKAISALSTEHQNICFVFPVHLNPNIRSVVFPMLKDHPNIKLLDPLSYDEIIYVMMKSYLILTDSGGIQEEAPALNVPVLVMRSNTERMEGILAGTAKLCGIDKKGIYETFEEVYNNESVWLNMSQAINPYGDGQSSTRIWEVLQRD